MSVQMAYPMDPRLLARMTGRLGDAKTIDTIASEMAFALTDPLRTALGRALSMPVSVSPRDIDAAAAADVIAAFGKTSVLTIGAIPGWPRDVVLAMDCGFVIAATERLLGGGDGGPAPVRPLSEIERDIAAVIFEAVAIAIQRVVNPEEEGAGCGKVLDGPLSADDTDLDGYAAALGLDIAIEGHGFSLSVIVAQSSLLKAPPLQVPADDAKPARETDKHPEWAEHLTKKVHTSAVTLEANVALAPITLATMSRLKPGDVLPFADENDVRVLLKANGKNLYWCEFGKAGQRYMLRAQDRYGSEQDFIRQLSA